MAEAETIKLTHATMFDPPELLYTNYEQALQNARTHLGQEYPMVINGEDYYTSDKFESCSPINTNWIMGTSQAGGDADAAQAFAAAEAAFPFWSSTCWQERVQLLRKATDLIEERV